MAAALLKSVERLRDKHTAACKILADVTTLHAAAAQDLLDTQQAQAALQHIALLTQSQLRYHVTALGTLAMEAVFPDPVGLELQFRENYGKTEAHLLFDRDGHLLDPLEEDSGGACNIAGLGLRTSMREAQRPRTRPVIIMDEPGHDLNDATRAMHEKFAEMIKEVSDKLGVQFLIVTMIEELAEVGEKIRLT
jgi:hypothetical protein